jgi:hypothetical protein
MGKVLMVSRKGVSMADDKKQKKGMNPLVMVGIGCFVLLVILGVVSSIAMKFFAKQIGFGVLQGVIQSKTGVKTNLGDIEKGNVTFTDEKTGAKVDVGADKLPDTFPKDFPVYPGAKVTGVLSGSEKGKSTGVWVTFTTADAKDAVASFYTTNLKSNGWTEESTFSSGDTTTQTVSKGTMNGTVGITRAADATETEIIVMLGADNTAQNTPAATETPTED